MRGRSKLLAPRGFTLVELLVVIGIIALLISILLPALNSARRQANTVKCASAMREIANAMAMYVNDNKGWAPPLRAYGPPNYTISYTNWNPPQDQALANQYWFCFLAKYVTRKMEGQVNDTKNANNTGSDRQNQMQNNILWGCPEWQPYVDTAFTGGLQPNDPGFGFNGFPEYTSTFPKPNMMIGDGSPFPVAAGDGERVSGVNPQTNGDWGNPLHGTWYRFNKYTNASQRCLVADSNWYFIECTAVPSINGPTQGQKVYNDQVVWIQTTGVDGETPVDVYRHGRLPPLAAGGNSGSYANTGGKIGYNILYCDGHVATINDRAEIYRSVRMRYPG